MNKQFIVKDFIIITLITSIWVNISELVRYFPYVRPEMMEYLSAIPHMGELNLYVALVWGFIDTLLTALYVYSFWLNAQVFGNNKKAVILSALLSWCFFFVLFWVGSANMYTAEWSNLLVVLPLALLETLVASFIASKLYTRRSNNVSK